MLLAKFIDLHEGNELSNAGADDPGSLIGCVCELTNRAFIHTVPSISTSNTLIFVFHGILSDATIGTGITNTRTSK